jgi:hypothetical protein
MSEKKERVFADGFSFKRNENAPEYVIGRLSMKADEAVAFIKKHANANGWVNVSILYGRSGNPYVELDTYEPSNEGVKQADAPRKAVAKPLGNIESNFQEDAIRELEEDEDGLPF